MKNGYGKLKFTSTIANEVQRVCFPRDIFASLGLLAVLAGTVVLMHTALYSRAVQRSNALQSRSEDLRIPYGSTRLPETHFGLTMGVQQDHGAESNRSKDGFGYLKQIATGVRIPSEEMHPLPGPQLANPRLIPSLWPVLGKVTSLFGKRLDPFKRVDAFHAGLDIASHYGDAIRATADGIVRETRWGTGYGRMIIIDHTSGISTWYCHLSSFSVKPKMHVTGGEIIGYEGQSGRSTGPHLHYEVRIYDAPVNPWQYLWDFHTSRS
jgi:murein DD-endopeptidase MepM/ murein hydrolase activator NlpD